MNKLSDTETTISQLRERVQKFVDDREWRKYHNPKNLSMAIVIEASELMELFQWATADELDILIEDTNNFAKMEEELADVIIFCLSLANTVNLDVTQAILKKITRNERKYPVERFKGTYKTTCEG